MSEGLDRKEAGEEPDGTLEDARKKFLEKYDDVGPGRQSEGDAVDSNSKDDAVPQAGSSDSKTEPTRLENPGGPDATLEEFREQTLEKYEEDMGAEGQRKSGPFQSEGMTEANVSDASNLEGSREEVLAKYEQESDKAPEVAASPDANYSGEGQSRMGEEKASIRAGTPAREEVRDKDASEELEQDEQLKDDRDGNQRFDGHSTTPVGVTGVRTEGADDNGPESHESSSTISQTTGDKPPEADLPMPEVQARGIAVEPARETAAVKREKSLLVERETLSETQSGRVDAPSLVSSIRFGIGPVINESELHDGLSEFGLETGRENQGDSEVQSQETYRRAEIEIRTGLPEKYHGTGIERSQTETNPTAEAKNKEYRAVKYERSAAIYVPERYFPNHTKEDVLEVLISKRDPERGYSLYTTHAPGQKKAYLDLHQIGSTPGEWFEIKDASIHTPEKFAENYNKSKPRGLENTELAYERGNLHMLVDGNRFELLMSGFRAQQGRAVIDGELGTSSIKISKGLDGVSVRLQDHSRVTAIKCIESGLQLRYERTDHDPYPHIRLIHLPLDVAGRNLEREMLHRFEVPEEGCSVSRPLSLKPDIVPLRISDEGRRKAWEYWALAPTRDERMYHQGDIGECIAETLLRKSRFRILEKESLGFVRHQARHRSERPGPDCIMERDGEYFINQTKHWRDSQAGLRGARDDVSAFPWAWRSALEEKLGAKIRGGLAVQVEWSYSNTAGAIYTDYVEFR